LVVVIVLLGILGVTASAKFADLSTAAQTATAQGVASEIAAGSVLNYGNRLVNNAGETITSVTNCAGLGVLLGANTFPSDISTSGATTGCPGGAGTVGNACQVFHTDGGLAATVVVTCDS